MATVKHRRRPPDELDLAINTMRTWFGRTMTATSIASVAIALTWITKWAWAAVVLAGVAVVVSFVCWWHYGDVLDAVLERTLASDDFVPQTAHPNGLHGLARRYPYFVGVALGAVLIGLILVAFLARQVL